MECRVATVKDQIQTRAHTKLNYERCRLYSVHQTIHYSMCGLHEYFRLSKECVINNHVRHIFIKIMNGCGYDYKNGTEMRYHWQRRQPYDKISHFGIVIFFHLVRLMLQNMMMENRTPKKKNWLEKSPKTNQIFLLFTCTAHTC